jgi:formylglycine-generating enzyme required for sulfatase activity
MPIFPLRATFSKAPVPLTIACLLALAGPAGALPTAPQLQVQHSQMKVQLDWTAATGASGYRLFYAAYPYTGEASIHSLDLGDSRSFSATLWPGAAFYVSIKSYQDDQLSDYSNIETLLLPNLPADLELVPLPAGSFVMGDNQLRGPAAGDASEHQVTLSAFAMARTEVTNAQYLEFLNLAYQEGLIEVIEGDSGADLGRRLVVGADRSGYAGKVLYDLDGSRVMKDHDNADGDDDPFTGGIEPENPLNIAYLGFSASNATQPFYLKDPQNPKDFDWRQLTDYQNYSAVSHQPDPSQTLNDLEDWPELHGWSESSPQAALPDKDEVAGYPVTFIRWWGARAFADYYDLRLPSEAQWEYAAKGGADFPYAVFDGASVDDANWNRLGESPARHHVRAALSGQPNPYGLYNLGGNAWEWMADNYAPYGTEPVRDPLVENGSTSRSWRGGSWNYHQATLESSGRFYDDENRGNDHFGFRVCR